jgi:hypothetical protein
MYPSPGEGTDTSTRSQKAQPTVSTDDPSSPLQLTLVSYEFPGQNSARIPCDPGAVSFPRFSITQAKASLATCHSYVTAFVR